jgi:hypothetical protein
MTNQILKEELKQLIVEIRELKLRFKEAQRAGNVGAVNDVWYDLWSALGTARYNYRHKHIVACIIRGTERDKIERPADNNKPSEAYINQLLEKYNAAVCCNS